MLNKRNNRMYTYIKLHLHYYSERNCFNKTSLKLVDKASACRTLSSFSLLNRSLNFTSLTVAIDTLFGSFQAGSTHLSRRRCLLSKREIKPCIARVSHFHDDIRHFVFCSKLVTRISRFRYLNNSLTKCKYIPDVRVSFC